jgi:hypothetical protein
MSVFRLPASHINALVNYAHYNDCLDCTPQYAFNTLVRENYRNINWCYQEDCQPPQDWLYRPDPRWQQQRDIEVKILKLANCYIAQSSEYEGWEDSEAGKIIDSITWRAVNNLPGYKEADWVCA